MKWLFFFYLVFHWTQATALPLQSVQRFSTHVTDMLSLEKARISRGLETFHRLPHAKVALADYDLIRTDFPELALLSQEQIDLWLVHVGGVISAGQFNSRLNPGRPVQSEITVLPIPGEIPDFFPANSQRLHSWGGGEVIAWRPYGYGRGAVLAAGRQEDWKCPWLLVDAKGTGVGTHSTPKVEKHHSSGLIILVDAFREMAMEKLVNQVFTHANTVLFGDLPQSDILKRVEAFYENRSVPFSWDAVQGIKTVQTYAVLATGFDQDPEGQTRPTGIVLRQAHHRAPDHDRQRKLEVGELLRLYGIENVQPITVTPEASKKHESKSIMFPCRWQSDESSKEEDVRCFMRRNIELASTGELVDFGTVVVPGNYFEYGVEATDTRQAAVNRRRQAILESTDLPADAELAISRELWGVRGRETVCPHGWDARCDRVTEWGWRMVEAWQEQPYQQARGIIKASLDSRLERVKERWSQRKVD